MNVFEFRGRDIEVHPMALAEGDGVRKFDGRGAEDCEGGDVTRGPESSRIKAGSIDMANNLGVAIAVVVSEQVYEVVVWEDGIGGPGR